MDGMEQGLGAIAPGMATPASMPSLSEQNTGLSRQSMEEIMDAARQLSDAQLADVLMGRSMEVPQFVAMSEAMGRKQLRTAMQGAQAQQQVQQPSLREQLLAESGMVPPMVPPAQQQPQQPQQPQQTMMPEEQGIGALPAPNMQQMGMAGGGIIAFSKGDVVQSPYSDEIAQQTERDRDMVTSGLQTLGAGFGDRLMLPVQALGSTGALFNRGLRAIGVPASIARPIPPEYTLEGASLGLGFGGGPMTTALQEQRAAEAQGAAQSAADTEQMMDLGTPDSTLPLEEDGEPTDSAASDTRGAGKTPRETLEESVDQALAPPSTDRFAQFDSEGAELQKTLDQQRKESQGEFLMQIGASLLTSPTIAQGLGEGVQQALPMLVANKREANKLRRDARDFQFNVARAQEAVEMGDREMAFKYEQLAAQKAYQTGRLAAKNAAGGEDKLRKLIFENALKNRTEAMKDFRTAKAYREMNEADKAAFDNDFVQQALQMYMSTMGGGMTGAGSQAGLSFDANAIAEELAKRGEE